MSSFRMTRALRRRWRTGRRAAAAMEFALVAPFMAAMAGGVYDLCQAVLVYNEVTNAATLIAASASSAAVNEDGSTALSYDQIQQAESGIWADIPELRNGRQAGSVKSVTVSSIDFQPPAACTSGANCNPYGAYVIWSVAYAGGSSGATFADNIRTCVPTGSDSDGSLGELQVPANAGLNASNVTYTLRTAGLTSYQPDPTGPAPVLAVDVVFTYTPLLGVIKTQFTFVASALWPVRTVKPVQSEVARGVTFLPLAQQFTKIYGAYSGGVFTPYAAPTSTTVPTTTPETDAVAGTYCINYYASAPAAYTASST
jgi:Flp pilus assembly pilin Flp